MSGRRAFFLGACATAGALVPLLVLLYWLGGMALPYQRRARWPW